MIEQDRARLLEFLARLRDEDLRHAMEYLDPELRDYAFAAWDELLGTGTFELLLDAIASREYDDALDRNGLGGNQLTFKLAVIDHARAQVDREEREEGPPRERRGRIRRWLSRLLGGSDVVLDSILDAIPFAGEALKEFKEAVGIALED